MRNVGHGIFALIGLTFMIETGHAQTLFKCELQDGKIAFQDMPCVQGRESARIETSEDREKLPQKNKSFHPVASPESASSQSAASRSVPRAPKPRRCPFTPVAGDDVKLAAQRQDMYAELFLVDDSQYFGAPPAPAAPMPGQKGAPVDPKIAQCGALSGEYDSVGDELLKVPPKSLPSVTACFQKESRRLDDENKRLDCGFTHMRLKRR